MTETDLLAEVREDLRRASAFTGRWGVLPYLFEPRLLAAITRYGDARAEIAMPLARLGLLALKGGEIQDDAERLGVVQPIEVTEACGENCDCAEYGDFPLTCSLTRHRPPPDAPSP